MSSIPSADRTEETLPSLNLYCSKAASAWFARLRMAEESSTHAGACARTRRSSAWTYFTDSTGNWLG